MARKIKRVWAATRPDGSIVHYNTINDTKRGAEMDIGMMFTEDEARDFTVERYRLVPDPLPRRKK